MKFRFDTFVPPVVALALGSAGAFTEACATAAEPPSQEAMTSRLVVSDLQGVAERELDRAVHEWNASGGTILVMSPKGEVLAEAGGRTDRTYVTGSTMKPILLAAAIDDGVVKESDVFDCSDGERGGRGLRDPSPLGHVGLPELVSRSSNLGFVQIFDRLGGARYGDALSRFHFAVTSELASAPPGDRNGAMIAIGATMSATPREVARAYAALADGGEGVVKPETASRVSALLEGVVDSEHGTGKKARVAGARVAGKTGSSAWIAPDGARMKYASFVGYVPADRPRYVIFVGVESPSGDEAWGGEVAAPVFSRVAARALGR